MGDIACRNKPPEIKTGEEGSCSAGKTENRLPFQEFSAHDRFPGVPPVRGFNRTGQEAHGFRSDSGGILPVCRQPRPEHLSHPDSVIADEADLFRYVDSLFLQRPHGADAAEVIRAEDTGRIDWVGHQLPDMARTFLRRPEMPFQDGSFRYTDPELRAGPVKTGKPVPGHNAGLAGDISDPAVAALPHMAHDLPDALLIVIADADASLIQMVDKNQRQGAGDEA